MASISTHLHKKPYQVAVSNDRFLEFRKWNHLGTIYDVSHESAAYTACRGRFPGDVVTEHPGKNGGVIFEFPGDVFIHVGFGT